MSNKDIYESLLDMYAVVPGIPEIADSLMEVLICML